MEKLKEKKAFYKTKTDKQTKIKQINKQTNR